MQSGFIFDDVQISVFLRWLASGIISDRVMVQMWAIVVW